MENKSIHLEKFYDLRTRAGKIHLFYSINKVIGRIGKSIKLDKVYISKDYLGNLSERLFDSKYKILNFFNGDNKYIRLSIVNEVMKDYDRDIVEIIQEEFMELKKYNSSIFSEVKKRLESILNGEKNIELEDLVLFENYLSNWKNLETKIKYFIPTECQIDKNNYFYNLLTSYIKYFEKYEKNYDETMNFLKNKIDL